MPARPLSSTTTAAFAVLILAGCGGGTSTPTATVTVTAAAPMESAGPAPSSTSDATEVDCDPESDLSMAEWTEYCGDVVADTTKSGWPEIPLGESYEDVDIDNPDRAWTVTVNGTECGITLLEDAAYNPEWDGSNDVSQTIDLEAEDGMQFCRIDATVQNTGKVPSVGWDDFDELLDVDGNRYASDNVAEEATKELNDALSGCTPTLCDSINPGTDAFDVVKIYHVPQGIEPRGAFYPYAALDSSPSVLLLTQ